MKLHRLIAFSTWAIRVRPVIIGILLAACTLTAFAQQSTTCHTCNPNYVPGNPVEGGKTLGQLSEISLNLLSDADSTYMGNLYGFCIEFPGDIRGAKTLRKRVIAVMEENLINGTIDSYFIEAGCNPEEIGRTRSPIAHLAAELPSVRTAHLEVIRAYFIEKKKTGLFTKMINAKNTQGHTTLDYVHYMVEKGKYIESQKLYLGTFISYLCENGGVYAYYKGKSCGAK